ISVTPANSSIAQTATDAGSIAQYMTRNYAVTTQLTDYTDALGMAQYIVGKYAQPGLRFTTMTIQPVADSNLWTQALTRDIGDRITVHRRPPDYSGETITYIAQDCF